MHRVAALYLPEWSIDRLRRAERIAARHDPALPPAHIAPAAAHNGLRKPQSHHGHWRPGAKWAREQESGADAALLPLPLAGEGRGEGESGKQATSPGAHITPSPAFAALGTLSRKREREEELPRVTSIRNGSRVEIAAASPAAQALGLVPGMALTQARAQVPGLDIHPADPEGDRADLERLALALARRWCPIVAQDGDDGLLLDITGTAHLFGGEGAMARRLVRLLARLGFTARIAVADTAGAARVLAHCTAGGLCPPGRQAQALAPLPLAALRIETQAVELLKRLGVESIGALAAMPRAPLARRFGQRLVIELERVLGGLPEPLDPVVPAQPIAVTRRFAEPIASAEAIDHWLGVLVPELVAELAQAGLGARRIGLIAERVDGVPQRIALGLAAPSRDAPHLLRLLRRRIETIAPGFGIDAMTLHLLRAEPLGPQPLVERIDEAAAPDLAPLVDTLATRIGMGRLWRLRGVESDVPERSVARAPVLDPPTRAAPRAKADAVQQLDRIGALPVWHPAWPRPARLLARPEPLDHVLAELPDQAPRRFTWRGSTHRVVRADGPERVQGEWWKRGAEAASIRDYFQVEDEAGRRYWLFRSGDGERSVTGDLSWYLHGVFG